MTSPILRWQYRVLTKELLLLEGHLSDPTCPCESGGEACVRKHALTIQGLAEETARMEEDEGRRAILEEIAQKASDLVSIEEDRLCGKAREGPGAEEIRKWRKQVEFLALACAVGGKEATLSTPVEVGHLAQSSWQCQQWREIAEQVNPVNWISLSGKEAPSFQKHVSKAYSHAEKAYRELANALEASCPKKARGRGRKPSPAPQVAPTTQLSPEEYERIARECKGPNLGWGVVECRDPRLLARYEYLVGMKCKYGRPEGEEWFEGKVTWLPATIIAVDHVRVGPGFSTRKVFTTPFFRIRLPDGEETIASSIQLRGCLKAEEAMEDAVLEGSRLTYAERQALPSSAFACPSLRKYPILDCPRAVNALQRYRQKHTAKCPGGLQRICTAIQRMGCVTRSKVCPVEA